MKELLYSKQGEPALHQIGADLVINRNAFFVCALSVVAAISTLTVRAQVAPTAPPDSQPWHMDIYVDAHGKPGTPFITRSSTLVDVGGHHVVGVPANNLGAAVALVSCSADFSGRKGPHYSERLHFTVFNETSLPLKYVRIAWRIDGGASYVSANLFDLKPHELRRFDDGSEGLGSDGNFPGFGKGYPQWMLCGAGPAEKNDGTVLKFEPEFLTR